MNHLAHAWLSAGEMALEVGGLMGDFVRGRPDPAMPARLRDGIALHRAIDGFTDGHPVVAALRARFEPPWRRYAGIMLDIWFDYALARELRGKSVDLGVYSEELRRNLRNAWEQLPLRMRPFVRYMEAHDLPAAYADPDMLVQVFAGLSQRLSRSNPLREAWPRLQADAAALDRGYARFFPELADFAADWRRRHPATTWPDPRST